MFKLEEKEIDTAIDAINHHGYSAMMPTPMEWEDVKENRESIRDYIKELDLDNYEPYKPVKTFAPKNRANIRVVHLLHPQDLIIYTALTLIVKNDIEKNRSAKSAKRVFSYRVELKNNNILYNARGAYEDYLSCLGRKSRKQTCKFVGLADIADFYPRIYQHRLENIIETVSSQANNQRGVDVARVLVRKLISSLMDRNSYGIPVGPYASRVLAEAILIDVDAFLRSRNIDFVRWVDDFNIFCKSEYEAQSSLFSLGEWLFTNHGLTLQSAKTKILTVGKFRDDILATPEDDLTDREAAVEILRDFLSDYHEGLAEADLDEEEVEDILAELHGLDLVQMVSDSISDEQLVDYEIVKYVLTWVPRMPNVPDNFKFEILDLVLDNAGLLYPVAEHIAKYVSSFSNLSKKDKSKIATKLLKPIKRQGSHIPIYYTMWILWIFSTSEDWNHKRDIIELYQNTRSEIVKRYAALAVARCGTRAEVLVLKDDYDSASDMLKLAIVKASKKLGRDERKHWKLSNQVNGILEKKI